MSTAAVVIDNFLESGNWNTIQNNLSTLNSSTYSEVEDSLNTQIHSWIQVKLTSLNLWQSSWEDDIKLFSGIKSLPKGIDLESGDPTNGGYHREQGGYIYYIHPSWTPSWVGHLKFKDCSVDKIEPKPNRWVWVNPDVWHGIEVVTEPAATCRVSAVAWPNGTVVYDGADIVINKI